MNKVICRNLQYDESTLDDIQELLSEVKQEYLKKRGWKHTMVICYWLWTKEINGQTFALKIDDAVDTQRKLAEYGRH